MANSLSLRFETDAGFLNVDVPTMLETRVLAQGSSGSGKTTLLFDMAQQMYGAIQQLIVDKEGQFGKLREKYDYLLVGPDGELALDTRKGAIELLLRKVLETQVNVIWDLSEMPPIEQKHYVARLVREAAHLPARSGLWENMRAFFIDEIQNYAPQGGSLRDEPALIPMIEFLSLSRKRGFCPIGATVRVERLSKDVSDMLENRLVGRSGDKSSKEAARLLDFDKHGQRELKQLQTFSFYAYGPALALDPVLVRCRTDKLPVRPRRRGELIAPPSTPKNLKKVLAAFENFAAEAEEHAHTVEELRAALDAAKRDIATLRKQQGVPGPVVDTKEVERLQRRVDDLERQLDHERASIDSNVAIIKHLGERFEGIKNIATLASTAAAESVRINKISAKIVVQKSEIPKQFARAPERIEARHSHQTMTRTEAPAPNGSLPAGEAAILTVACQYPNGASREKASILTGYKRSTRNTYIQRLEARGLVTTQGSTIYPAAGAKEWLPNFTPLPTGAGARDYWLAELPEGEAAIMRVLFDDYPGYVTRDTISEKTGYKRSTRNTYLQRLDAKDLIENAGDRIRPSAIFYEE